MSEISGQLGKSSYAHHGKSFGFNLRTLSKHPGIAPIVVIIGGVVVGVTAWCSYAMATKMDVQVVNKHRWEKLDLTKPQPTKLFTIQQEYRAMPELNQLLKDINEADKQSATHATQSN